MHARSTSRQPDAGAASPVAGDFEIVIVGAGLAGIAMAMSLMRAGLESFVLIEKASEIGGTWFYNTYPGCTCDIPSHLYSLFADMCYDWPERYSAQPEILNYLHRLADRHRLRPKILLGWQLDRAVFDASLQRWQLFSIAGRKLTTRILIGVLSPNTRNF